VLGYKGINGIVELDNGDTAYIEKTDLKMMPGAPAPAVRTAKAFTVVPSQEYVDVNIPMSERPAHLVEESQSTITLTLYGTAGAPQPAATLPASSYVSSVSSAASGPQMRYTFSLRGPAYGYLAVWRDSVLTFRIRRPPTIDPVDPLKDSPLR
jgi:hypothetical protein